MCGLRRALQFRGTGHRRLTKRRGVIETLWIGPPPSRTAPGGCPAPVVRRTGQMERCRRTRRGEGMWRPLSGAYLDESGAPAPSWSIFT
jgi:hypothetical protein